MSHSSVSMSLLIKYSKVFSQDQLSPEEILRPYGKTLTLKMIGVLNRMLAQDLKELPQQIISWFGPEGPLGQQMMLQIMAGYRDEIKAGAKLTLVNQYANLTMNIIAKQLDEVDENTAINIDQSHLDFFKAYLKINEAFLLKQDNILSSLPEEMEGIEKATWMNTVTMLSYYDFTYIDRLTSICQLIKAMYCFEFIEAYNPALYKLFIDSKKITGFKDYALKMLPLTELCFSDLVSFNGSSEENQDFLELYNHQTDIEVSEENTAKFDFLAIRNKPIYGVGNNDYVILNRAMVINKVYSSVYWDCKAILKANHQLGISEDRFRVDFTTDFSEGYLVYKLLKKAYEKKSCKQFSGAEMKAEMAQSEPDYYIRNGNKVFIYEVKDSFIAGKSKQSFDVPTIREDIEKKYYKHNNSEKAVKQLITRIKFSLQKEYPFDTNYNPRSLRFYPILIVYDINLTVPGVESLITAWFNTEREQLIAEMTEKCIKGYHINDIVILHIDALILLSEYIRANKLKMEDLIDKHLARKRDLLKLNQGKTFDEVKANVLNSYVPFNGYVMDHIQSLKPKDKILPPEFLLFAKPD
nr:hypothetical protein [Pedobacter sp. ASV19]